MTINELKSQAYDTIREMEKHQGMFEQLKARLAQINEQINEAEIKPETFQNTE